MKHISLSLICSFLVNVIFSQSIGVISGDTTACQNTGNYVYSVNPVPDATSYTWTHSAGVTITDGQDSDAITVAFGPTSISDTIWCFATFSTGLTTEDTASIEIAVNPLPTATVSGSLIACGSTSLAAVTNASSPTFRWYKDDVVINGQTAQTLVVDVSGTYKVKITDGFTGCEETSTPSSVIINSLPTATISGNLTACASTTLTSVTNAMSPGFIWYKDDVAIDGQNAQTLVVETSGAYKVKITDGVTGCEETSTPSNVIINSQPTATITGNLTACTSTTLIAVTNATSPTFMWYKDNVVIDGQTAQTLIIESSGTYQVKITDGLTGCEETSTPTNVIINSLPTATITGTLIACASTTLTAITNATSPTFMWYKDDVVIEGQIAQTLVVVITGAYKVTVTDGVTGCEETSSVANVIINQNLTASVIIEANPSGPICAEQSVTFTATPTNGGTPAYQWKKGIDPINGATNSSYTSTTLADEDLITVVMTSTLPCIAINPVTSNGITMTVHELPNTSAITGNPTPVCNEVGVTYSVILTPGSSYIWAVPEGAVITTGQYGPDNNQITVTFGSSNGNITVIETNTNSCVGITKTIAISLVGCSFDANFIGNPLTICQGSTVTFTNISTGTTESTTYSWDFGSGANPATANTIGPHEVTYSSSGSKTVSLTITDGVLISPETKENYINVNQLPTATITGTLTACSTTTLTAVTDAVSPTYVWYKDNVVIGGQTAQTLVVTASGAYKVKVTNGVTGCEKTSSASAVIIYPLPTATITGTLTACITTTLTAVTDAVSPTYVWYKDNVVIGGQTAQTLVVTASGAYKVKVTNGVTGCEKTSLASAVIIYPLPTATITGTLTACVTTTLTAVTDAVSPTYVWYKDNVVIGGQTAQTLVVTVSGAYKVKVTNGVTGCEKTSLASAVIIYPLPTSTINGTLTACITTTLTAITDAVSPTYVWYKDNVVIGGQTAQTLVVTVSGTYKVKVTNGVTGCEKTSSPSNVVINPLPTASITGTLTACVTTTLTAVTDAVSPTYVWYKDNVVIGGQTAQTLVVTVSGAYKVKVTNGVTGCEKTSSPSNVVINPLPTASITGSLTACVTTTLTAVTDAVSPTYVWYKDNVVIGGQTAQTLVVTVSGAYKVKVTNGVTGCEKTSLVSAVIINPLPNVNITGSNSICINTTTNLSPTSGGIWISNNPTVASVTNTGLVTGLTAGNATFTFTLTSTGCSNTTSSITVNPLPIVAGSPTACINSQEIYSTIPGMSNYYWAVTGGAFTPSDTNQITVTWGNTPGAFTVQVSYAIPIANCISTSLPLSVFVNSFANPVIYGSNEVCENTQGQQYFTQPEMNNYEWNIGGGEIITGQATNTITVDWGGSLVPDKGWLKVIYVNPTGCPVTGPGIDSVTINPRPPVPIITGPTTACLNSTGNLYSTQTGMRHYNWSVPGGQIAEPIDTSTIAVTWISQGPQYISVNYTNQNGCTAITPVTYPVLVNILPTPIITGPTSVCLYSSGNSYSTQSGMSEYSWLVHGGHIVGPSDTSAITVTWDSLGSQYVSVNYTNSNGCTAIEQTNYSVIVNALPIPSITGPDTVCRNSTGNSYFTETGMSNYNWSVPGGTYVYTTDSSNIIVTWDSSGEKTVSVNYTNINFCAALNAAIMNITVNPLPAADAGQNQSICHGASVQIGADTVVGSTYAWTSVPDGYSSTDPDPIVNPEVTTTYTLIETNTTTGCSNSNSVVVTVYSDFAVGSITNDQSICYNSVPDDLLGTNPTGGNVPYTYQWLEKSPGDIKFSEIPGATNLNYTPGPLTEVTYYRQIQSSASGCGTDTTNNLTISVFPLPMVNPIADQAWCNGVNVPVTPITGQVPGTTFTWTNNNTSIGLEASGTGNVFHYTAANNGIAPITAMITITPTANGCVGPTSTYSIVVNPKPTVTTLANQTWCKGFSVPITTLTSPVAGTTFTWTNSNTSIGLAASGTGNVLPFTAENDGTNPITAVITITPTASGCQGSMATYSIVVSSPVVLSQISVNKPEICLGKPSLLSTQNISDVIKEWQKKYSTATNWDIIAGSAHDSAIIDTAKFSGQIQYRTVIKSGACSEDYSELITVRVINAPDEQTLVPKADSVLKKKGELFLLCKTCDNDTVAFTYLWSYINSDGDTINIPAFTNRDFCLFPVYNTRFTYTLEMGAKNANLCSTISTYKIPDSQDNADHQNTGNVFPVPNTGKFTLNLAGDYTGKITVNVKDMLGRTFVHTLHTKQPGNMAQPFDTHLQAGIYLVEVLFGKEEKICIRMIVN